PGTTSPSPGEDASPLVHQFYLPLVTNQGDNQKDVQDGEQQAKSAATAASNALQTSEIHYTYDTGINGIGRLTEIHLPFASIFHTHDARGLVKVEKRTLSLSGVATLKTTQMVSREYNALGQPPTAPGMMGMVADQL
ncbi:hypothetical protein KFU94_32835, partial [Chloroflexi bacterium TSY]|nr:hypothetical protein [Chloroflexi bacterium TSY]